MWPRHHVHLPDAHFVIGLSFGAIDFSKIKYEPYVGENHASMGVDVIRNVLRYNKTDISRYPHHVNRDFIMPTLFYMYIDMDEGTLGFGSDSEYWGTAFNFGKLGKIKKPMFVALSSSGVKGKVMMFYKGEGECIWFSLIRGGLIKMANIWLTTF